MVKKYTIICCAVMVVGFIFSSALDAAEKTMEVQKIDRFPQQLVIQPNIIECPASIEVDHFPAQIASGDCAAEDYEVPAGWSKSPVLGGYQQATLSLLGNSVHNGKLLCFYGVYSLPPLKYNLISIERPVPAGKTCTAVSSDFTFSCSP